MRSKKASIFLALVMIATVFAVAVPLNASAEEPLPPEEPIEPPFPDWMVEGTGTYFETTNSDYLDITMTSSEIVHVCLESIPRVISYCIESASLATSTDLTFTGFEASKTYYRYQNGYLQEEFTTDEYGSYFYTQEITIPHHVFIQEEASTKYIRDDATGGDGHLIGRWNWQTKTLTLTTDVIETIVIDDNGITLDGDGHSVTDVGSYGIYVRGRSGITIMNVVASGNTVGFWLLYSNGNTISGNTVSGNQVGIALPDSSSNTISGNTVSGSGGMGIYLFYKSNSNIISGNTVSGGYFGIDMVGNSNTISGNTVSGGYSGIRVSSNSNTISGNTVSGGKYGIWLFTSGSNIISGNTISGSTDYGIYLDTSNGNTFFHNNFIDNAVQLYNGQYTNTWDNGDGEGNYWSDYSGLDNGANGRVAGDGVGDTEIPHLDVDWYPLMVPYELENMVEDIIEEIQEMDLPQGIEDSAESLLENAIDSLENDQDIAVVNQLQAFISMVEALRGKKYTDEQADALIAAAQAIIDYLLGA